MDELEGRNPSELVPKIRRIVAQIGASALTPSPWRTVLIGHDTMVYKVR